MFYELPLARYRDFSNVAGLPAGAPANAIGLGDMNLKFLATPKAFEFTYPSPKTPKLPSKEGKMRGNVLVGMDMTFPTATDDALAGNALLLAPILALVMDLPLYGFVALLNLYVFDVYKTDAAPETSRYVGRWFFMQPLTPPGEWWGGVLYIA